MFRKKEPQQEDDRPNIDWSDPESIRKEWPNEDLDEAADLQSWLLGKQLYDQVGDDYPIMMRAGELMCQALRHHLYGDGILTGAKLPNTVHSVLFASTSKPPDGVTLSPPARRQIRLALTIMRKHGWQPAHMGGNSMMEALFSPPRGMWLLFSAALAPPGTPLGDLTDFFTGEPRQ
ncbi:hypothetical protein [Micromonospora sp. NBC_00858]|uniref:hypothetical protein n=1 Tax=Micromonospora sp. NBC_00858 TaxID=2975979 RepID=UPI00386D3EE8|nr:hypothetical protein OG990_16060 [Micromonospora sp. NBC_00858]